MSIQSEIDRISNEVNTQTELIEQLSLALENKVGGFGTSGENILDRLNVTIDSSNDTDDESIVYPSDAPDIFAIDIPDDMTKSVIYYLYKRTPDGFISLLASTPSCTYEVGYMDNGVFNVIDTISGTTINIWYPQEYPYIVVRATLTAVGNIRPNISPVPTLNNGTSAIAYTLQQMIAINGSIPTLSGFGTSASGISSITKNTQKVRYKNATTNLKTCSRAFMYGFSLTDIEFINFDTSNITSMYGMFDNCFNIKSINLSGFNTKKVTNFEYCFDKCYKLTNLNLDGIEITNACTTTAYMFDNCYKLKKVPQCIADGNYERVTTMAYMFDNCHSLENIDVSNWNVSSVKNFSYLFNNCFSLKEIDTLNWINNICTNTSFMFCYCLSLKGTIDLSGFTGELITTTANMFRWCYSLNKINLSNFQLKVCTTTTYMFATCRNITDIVCDFTKWDMSKITTMTYMFNSCASIEELNLSGWSLDSCTAISYIFDTCLFLKKINVSNWNLPLCKSFDRTFYDCRSLKQIDLSTWKNMVSPTTFANMFYGCYSLIDLRFPTTVNTSSVTNLSSMFNYCYSLKEIPEPMNSWDYSKVTTVQAMFAYCYSLINADISNWYGFGNSLTSLNTMFNGCAKLKRISLRGLSFPKVTTMQNFIANSNSICYCDLDNIEFPVISSTSYYWHPTNEGLIEYYPPKIYHNMSCNVESVSYESLLRVLNAVVPVTTNKTLTLGNNRKRLTVEQMAIAIDKGWTVA